MAGQPPTSPSAASTPAGLPCANGGRDVDVAPGQELQRAEFVAAARDRDRAVQDRHAHDVELADHGEAVVRDARADARDDDVVAGDGGPARK
jgi:hypothetical protein